MTADGGEAKWLVGPVDLNPDDGWFGSYGYMDWENRVNITKKSGSMPFYVY